MSVTIKLEVDDEVSPTLVRVLGGLTDRTRLNSSIATEAENLTREYLRRISGSRHKTAQRLGATPTNHLSPEGERVSSTGDAEAAEISIRIPGISRAFGDVTITATASKYLTIPATAEAYGKRAGEFNDLRLAVFGGGRFLALVKAEQSDLATRRRSGFGADQQQAGLGWRRRGTVYFWLKKSVHQKQDRTLLPSDAAYLAAAEEGAVSYLQMLMEAREAPALA